MPKFEIMVRYKVAGRPAKHAAEECVESESLTLAAEWLGMKLLASDNATGILIKVNGTERHLALVGPGDFLAELLGR